ncbi:MAG: hypothetical protein D6805_05935 [Planctomycetota bacterium]|nr:MAG: hypothetical protein D6805_05935 [Planctomycetota bacterium]
MNPTTAYLFCPSCQKYFALPTGRENHRFACRFCKRILVLRQNLNPSPLPKNKSPDTANQPLLQNSNWQEETADPEKPTVSELIPDTKHQLPQISSTISSSQPHHYKVCSVLGEGGCGRVYLAREQFLRRAVALKVILGNQNELAQKRFLREILITSHLEHPNITPVYEGGRLSNGSLFYVMKKIEGFTFQDYLKKRNEQNYSLHRCLEIFLKVCDAIEFAHSKGIIHRDLKPSNIAVGKFGEVIVMDWGLAKFLHQKEKTNSTNSQHQTSHTAILKELDLPEDGLSMSGSMLGTPGYMPPEQANGRDDLVGPQSDVYALGAILYQILAFTTPFEGNTRQILSSLLLKSPPSPRQKRPDLPIPRALDAICMKALEREVEDRYSTVRELAKDIQNYLEDQSVSVYVPPLSEKIFKFVRRHSVALSFITLILAFVGAFGYLLALSKQQMLREKEKNLALEQEKRKQQERALKAEQEKRKQQEQTLKIEMEKRKTQERLLAAEKEKKRLLQEKLERAQKEREFNRKLRLAYRPFLTAQNLLQRKMTFANLKNVVLPLLKKAVEIQPEFWAARWEIIKVHIALAQEQKILPNLMGLIQVLNKEKKGQKLSNLIQSFLINPVAFKKRRDWIQKLDEYRPDFLPDLYWQVIKVFIFRRILHKPQEAYKFIDQLLSKPTGQSWEVYLFKSIILNRDGRVDEALSVLHKILEDYPQLIYAYIVRAQCYRRKNNLKRALEDYKTVLRMDPSCHILWRDMADVYREKAKSSKNDTHRLANLLAARRCLQRTNAIEPNHRFSKIVLSEVNKEILSMLGYPSEEILESKKFLNDILQRTSNSPLLQREFGLFVYEYSHLPQLVLPYIEKAKNFLHHWLKKYPNSLEAILAKKALQKFKELK